MLDSESSWWELAMRLLFLVMAGVFPISDRRPVCPRLSKHTLVYALQSCQPQTVFCPHVTLRINGQLTGKEWAEGLEVAK